jgi:hypothetical protein
VLRETIHAIDALRVKAPFARNTCTIGKFVVSKDMEA